MEHISWTDFTWKTDTTIHNINMSEITLVLPKGSFPKIDYPAFLGKGAGLKAFFAHEPVISVVIEGKAKRESTNAGTLLQPFRLCLACLFPGFRDLRITKVKHLNLYIYELKHLNLAWEMAWADLSFIYYF
jgi:hypothetical protein